MMVNPQGWGNWSSNVHYDERPKVYMVSKSDVTVCMISHHHHHLIVSRRELIF